MTEDREWMRANWPELIEIFLGRLGLPTLEGTPEDVESAEDIRIQRADQLLVFIASGAQDKSCPWFTPAAVAYAITGLREKSAEKWIATSNKPFWGWVGMYR